MNKNNQFKTLVQHELTRLEAIIHQNESAGRYPVAYRQYAISRRGGKIKQPGKYMRGFFSFARALQFMSF